MKKTLLIWATWLLIAEAQALELSPCYIGADGSATSTRATCGTLTVPENRQQPNKTIELNIAVLRSTSKERVNDPLLLLAGGPGQGAVDTFAGIAPLFEKLLPNRDVVMVDQRGTGASNPLRCEIDEDEYEALSDPDSDAWKTWTQECHASLDADTTQYTTTTAIEDLEAVREALGYEQWNLYGGSYGTRKALTYMRM